MRVIIGLSLSFLALFLSSCPDTYESQKKPIVISTDVWIGAAPLYYAREMGWLQDINIQMLQARSINENMGLFERGASDIFTGTQHEYKREHKNHSDLIPIIIYDRSYGGDVVMANRSLAEIRNSDEKIDVYLEADSISEELLEYLVHLEGIKRERFVIHNRAQDEMAQMKTSRQLPLTLVVTYNPHDLILKKNGFMQIASSKDERYLVIDAIYVPKKLYQENMEVFQKLNDVLERSLQAYEENPKAFYEKVNPYLGHPSYDEFMQMRNNVRWMNKKPSPEMLKRLNMIEFPTQDLIL